MNKFLHRLGMTGLVALAGLAALPASATITSTYSGTLAMPDGRGARLDQAQNGNSVYRPIAVAQQAVMSRIKSEIQPKIKDALQSVNGAVANSAAATVSGPIYLQLKNGVASFWGLQATGSVRVQQQKFGITVSCQIQATVSSATRINGTLDPYTGVFTFANIENFAVTPTYTCDTSLDWVPFVNIVVDAVVDHYVDQAIANGVRTAYNALGDLSNLAPVQLMGLNSLPNNLFLVNGVDLWPSFKTDLANAFWSADLTMTIGDPKHYIKGPTGYAHIATSNDQVFSLNFNGYSFSLWDNRTYVDEVFCPNTRVQPYCFFN
ncbi:hypothetical protein [Mitsuaria sp. GD03876]|uniref:hypothetical protein n=1 Tax=Mitsuaria sp. GD03876 TaxID=2975399 RepID=UPI002449EFCD|nr:hypothetical protein [Mitsuaria sp. GD03876]MDH0865485.1 hypothetical protein [Mitsuaria sp. GD03876]